MTSGPYRLARGGDIDRTRIVSFQFDRQILTGFEGDSLASALLANGVRIVARSMRFRRPRGIFSCGMEEPNGLVQISDDTDRMPSRHATLTPLTADLHASSQSGWPSARFDLLALLDVAAPLFVAGFYNKTFMWPKWSWFEPVIRRLAGFGRAAIVPDGGRYEACNGHCDVLIIGAGMAGMSAALSAVHHGAHVWLVDQDDDLGGYARGRQTQISGRSAAEWIEATRAALTSAENCRILLCTTAVGCYGKGVFTLIESRVGGATPSERFWTVRAERVVLATGATEQPLIFDHNDRPGIFLAGAASRYLHRYAVAAGRRVLLAANNDSAYEVALELHRAGIRVVGIADSRAQLPDAVATELASARIPLYLGTLPTSAHGSQCIRAVTLRKLTNDAQSAQSTIKVPCDALLVSGGWNPNLQLFTQAGGALKYDEQVRALSPLTAISEIAIVGGAASISDVDLAIRHAAQCGAGRFVDAADLATRRDTGELGPRTSSTGNPWRQWVDLRHDVTVGDLQLAVRENFRAIEHIKRYTTLGMAADQGKTSQVSAIELVAAMLDISAASVGHTTMRPPVMPVTLGAIAGNARGDLFALRRESPLHAWHVANGALIEQYGEWQRPACYGRRVEDRQLAIDREAHAVRAAAGLFDASPLGKIEIQGPDAREFLNRFYINRVDNLQPGRIRYGIMLRESGVIFDDGTIVAIDPTHLLITTTSGNAARVGSWLEEWRQCEWPSLRVAITAVTEQWATMSLAGPKARQILGRLRPSCNLEPQAFPHLAFRSANLLGVPVRICRVSFSGELTYEISVPANAAINVWEALIEAGRGDQLIQYGVESLLRLRLEKGYLHVGTDTDGTTLPDDVGWGSVASAKECDFIGKRSLLLPEHAREDRLQLVGLKSSEELVAGAHLRLPGSQLTSDGWITSATRLTSEDCHVALAMVRRGRSCMNRMVAVHDGGRQVGSATITSPPFYDPGGARLNE